VITIHQRHRQTDRRTDRQTTCDRNTALCTKVHRAVKTEWWRTEAASDWSVAWHPTKCQWSGNWPMASSH